MIDAYLLGAYGGDRVWVCMVGSLAQLLQSEGGWRLISCSFSGP